MYAPYLLFFLFFFFFISGTRSRNSEPYHFRRLPSALSLLAIPFQKPTTHPPTVLHHLHYCTHTKSHSLRQIRRQDPVQPVHDNNSHLSLFCVCASISFFILFYFMHIISSVVVVFSFFFSYPASLFIFFFFMWIFTSLYDLNQVRL